MYIKGNIELIWELLFCRRMRMDGGKNDYQKSERKRYSENFRVIRASVTNSCRYKAWYFYSGHDQIYDRRIERAFET